MRLSPLLLAIAAMSHAAEPATTAATADPQRLDPNFAVSQPGSELLWYDAAQLTVAGQGWPRNELKRTFDRLPGRAEALVRPEVWSLSRHSAGIEIRFQSDASEIGARWKVLNKGLAMDHMPATGMSGLDLYLRHDGAWRWVGVGRPKESPVNLVKLASIPAKGLRDYRLYLPLYNGTEELQLGVPKGAVVRAVALPPGRPVVVYGTSIVQGGCASRPGMAYTAILGRWLDVPVINLGFSGNGRAEPEVAALVAEIDAAAFVLDPLPNLTDAQVKERMAPFIATLRAKHPQTPIVLVENITYQHAWVGGGVNARSSKNNALKAIAEPLMKADPLISYVNGETLLGDDSEATVDGTHPTDLGFLRMAEAIRPVLAKALAR